MWSVWSDTAELYLGQTVAMLRAGPGETPLVVEHGEPLSVDQALSRISSEFARQGLQNANRSRRLHVLLSGSLCPALTYVVPKQVTRWAEHMEIARATAAMAIGTTPDQLVCEMAADGRGLASAISVQTMAALKDWAVHHRFNIMSMQPLWAIASQTRKTRDAAVHGLMVFEADSITILADAGKGGVTGSTQPGYASAAEGQANTRRLLVRLGLQESQLLKLGFGPTTQPKMLHGPTVWPDHWYAP